MSSKVIALDIETSGLSPWRDQIYMCGIYDGETYTCMRSAKDLQALLKGKYQGYDIVGHRTDFDVKFLLVHEWLTDELLGGRVVHDSRILASLVKQRVPREFLERYEETRKVLNKSLPKGHTHREGSPLSLKVLAPWYLKVPMFWEMPGNHDDEAYNEKDCLYTFRLFKLLGDRLKEEGGWDFYLRLLEWSQMLREMELKGVNIDLTELAQVEKEYTKKRDDAKAKLDLMWEEAHHTYYAIEMQKVEAVRQEMLDRAMIKAKDKEKCKARYEKGRREALAKIEPFNYDSPTQMAWLLKDFLGLDITNADGDESTGRAVLHKLASDGRKDIESYLEYREAEKVLTMYVPTYRDKQVNGAIHANFNLVGTRTGRTSCANPNLQQVPSELYRIFKPRPGHQFVIYDLSGIEAALIALYSGDRTLYDMLARGESIHDYNAKALFELDCDVSEVKKKYPEQRQCAKNLGFACFYGAGAKRILATFANAGFVITEAEAKKKLKNLQATYPRVFEFHKEITGIFEAGETVSNLLGRPITLQAHDNPYMQGFNTLIQSSASDLNLLACERWWKQNQGTDTYPLLVIHDCIFGEAGEGAACAAAELLEKCMTNFKLESEHGPIKLKVEGGIGHAWTK